MSVRPASSSAEGSGPAEIGFGLSCSGEPGDRLVVPDGLGELFHELVHPLASLGGERGDGSGQVLGVVVGLSAWSPLVVMIAPPPWPGNDTTPQRLADTPLGLWRRAEAWARRVAS